MDCIKPFNYTELSKKLTTDINKTEKKIMVFILHHLKLFTKILNF